MSSVGDLKPYRERLRVPVAWWLLAGIAAASFWVAMVVAMPFWLTSTFAGLLAFVIALGLVVYGAPRIVVSGDWFQAGRATIEARYIGSVESLDRVRMREVAGPQADVRAYLLLRPYLARGVRINLADPADPTPYWLVSSRRPDALAAALERCAATRADETGSPP